MAARQLVTFALMLLAAAPAAAADWLRVETPNFVVFSQAGDGRTKEIALELERFREAIRHVLPEAATRSPVPTIVVIFENQRAFAPYRPHYEGKPVSLGGYFVGTETDNLIALAVDHRDDALRTIFHEYTHLIMANASRPLPTWVSEGVAEFYSTFSLSRDGKRAVLGGMLVPHLVFLLRNGLLKHDALLAVDDSSALYHQGQRRSTFYAQSWAMVHMLLAGKPNRSKELAEYMRLAATGVSSADAWRRAFGDLDVNREFARYIRTYPLPIVEYTFEEQVAAADGKVSRALAEETEAVLAAFLRHAKPDDLESTLQRATTLGRGSMLARALLGFTRVRDERPKEGIGLLLEAASDTSNWLVQYYVASGLTEAVRLSFDRRDEKELISAALSATNAVLAARPELAQALAMKADLQNDVELVGRARVLAPGRADYILIEARIRADAGDTDTARRLLQPLLSPSVAPEMQDAARSLLRQIKSLK